MSQEIEVLASKLEKGRYSDAAAELRKLADRLERSDLDPPKHYRSFKG